MADSGYLDFPTAVPPIAWDVHAVYTYYNGTWGITPRYTTCWNDVTATFRPLLMDKQMEWTRPDGTEDTELKLLQRQVALGNLGIVHATTESYGLARYTDDWTDDGTSDPEDVPLTLTRQAISGMLEDRVGGKQDKLTAGLGIAISSDNVISAPGSVPFDGNMDADLNVGTAGGQARTIRLNGRNILDMPPAHETSLPSVLLHNHTYYIQGSVLDLDGISVQEDATCELVVDGSVPSQFVWPAWYWENGRSSATGDHDLPPAGCCEDATKRYCITLRNDRMRTIANLRYQYPLV